MAELNTKFHCKKDGVTEEITAYTTLDEVQNTGIEVTIDGIDGYIKYGAADDENASKLNCKVGGSNYRVHKTAIPPVTVTLLCYDVETEQQISAIKYPLPDDRTLYLNNENAPSVAGYDFVMMDGVKYTNVAEDDVFYVWYVAQSIPDRTKTHWSGYFPDTTTEVLANTYSATSLAMLCTGCSSLDNVHRLNTSNATDMRHMFSGCTSLTSVPEMDTSNVTQMGSMFHNCTSLTSVPEMDTSNVTDMYWMFSGCTSLTSVPEMDTSNVTEMRSMFEDCTSLTNVPEMDTSNVTNMYSMFNSCTSLTSVPEMDTSNVTDMYSMFNGCTALASVPEMDTSNVTNMSYMFHSCSSLTSVDWEIDMSSCTNCQYMCGYDFVPTSIAVKLKNVPSSLDLTKIGTTNYTVVNYI